MKLFTTFGHGQYGGVLANCYLEFEGEASEEQAEDMVRRFMSESFKGIWCGLYNEEQFEGQRQHYNLSRLAKLDLHGNVRERMHDTMHCSFSTGIDGQITAGRGALDANGFWEFPCEPCATRANERLSTRLEDQKRAWEHGYDAGADPLALHDPSWQKFLESEK
jgi:hypothetical protein